LWTEIKQRPRPPGGKDIDFDKRVMGDSRGKTKASETEVLF